MHILLCFFTTVLLGSLSIPDYCRSWVLSISWRTTGRGSRSFQLFTHVRGSSVFRCFSEWSSDSSIAVGIQCVWLQQTSANGICILLQRSIPVEEENHLVTVGIGRVSDTSGVFDISNCVPSLTIHHSIFQTRCTTRYLVQCLLWFVS